MKVEVYITYCIFNDGDIRFETEDRAVARQWIKEREGYIMKVCASCEISSGGAMEFGYGDTVAGARKALKKRLEYYGKGVFTI